MKKPRVLLADDHALLLEAFQRLLERDFEVMGSFTDGAVLVEEAVRLRPDAVVLDVAMPRMNGLEAARRLRERAPRVPIVFLTVNEDPRLAAEGFRVGGSAWVIKSATATELVEALRAVLRGERYLTRSIAGGDPEALPPPGGAGRQLERLSGREREVLQLLAEGRTMKEIASTLGITTRTVAFHKYRLMESLGIRTNADLVRFAVRHRLV
jgi:DNA-binding NarL/FixJ family response regulator